MSDSDEFARRTDPYRRELFVHCYRMVGSVHDAEDLVQETYLRAWRSYPGFEGRSSLRTWLYRIATNRCLTALEHRDRRPLPSGLGGPSDDPLHPPALPHSQITWLQPFPDAGPDSDPAAVAMSRGGMRLAVVAALQHLPPRQRAVLILRDVLAWPAAEVAVLLDTTTAAVNSALQRARAQLAEAAPAEDRVTEPAEPARRALLDRYVAAFENGDTVTLTRLLTEDVVWEMPPHATWYAGRETVGEFVGAQVLGPPGVWRLVPVVANGQPAFGAYRRDDDGIHRAHAVQVLSLAATGVSRVVSFLDAGLFTVFGLPAVLRPAAVYGLAGGHDGVALPPR